MRLFSGSDVIHTSAVRVPNLTAAARDKDGACAEQVHTPHVRDSNKSGARTDCRLVNARSLGSETCRVLWEWSKHCHSEPAEARAHFICEHQKRHARLNSAESEIIWFVCTRKHL